MSKITLFVGIDISKDTFDVYEPSKGYEKFKNETKGFEKFKKWLDSSCYCLMEVTGSYHQQLASFLFENGIELSVVNPLIIKRFIQMKLQRNKTDKSDAKMIALYGRTQELEQWQPNPEHIEECKFLQGAIAVYKKQKQILSNKLHSLSARGVKNGIVVRSLKKQKKAIQTEINTLESELQAILKIHEPQMLTRLISIPGIGIKTAMHLMVSTNSFKNFVTINQLKSFFGLNPSERQSGSSIRGRTYISKTGNGLVRSQLFICSLSAIKYNSSCKALYQRLLNKGKSKMLALIAVCNKLLAQAFGIAKSNLNYDENFKGRLAMEC